MEKEGLILSDMSVQPSFIEFQHSLRPQFASRPSTVTRNRLSTPLRSSASPSWTAALPATLPRRFASTTPQTPLQNLSSPAPAAPPAPSFPDPALSDFTADTSTAFTPYIGFLRDAGLDFGWGPSSTVQWCLEHLHVYSGLPWIGSITVTAVLMRVLFFKFILDSADMGGRMAVMQPHIKPLQEKMKAARAAQDQQKMQECAVELRQVYAASGVDLKKMILPIVIQAPIGFGAFRTLRALAAENVPGLEDGGVLWMTDLTLRDPTLILPAVTSAMLYYTFKKGGEMGTSAAQSQSMMNTIRTVAPVLSFVATWWQPASVQVYFAATSCLAYGQNFLLSRPEFRRRVGIQPLPASHPAAAPTAQSGYQGKITKASGFLPSGLGAGAPGVAKEGAQSATEPPVGRFSWRSVLTRLDSKLRGMAQGYTDDKARMSRRERENAKQYEKKRREEIKEEKWRRGEGD